MMITNVFANTEDTVTEMFSDIQHFTFDISPDWKTLVYTCADHATWNPALCKKQIDRNDFSDFAYTNDVIIVNWVTWTVFWKVQFTEDWLSIYYTKTRGAWWNSTSWVFYKNLSDWNTNDWTRLYDQWWTWTAQTNFEIIGTKIYIILNGSTVYSLDVWDTIKTSEVNPFNLFQWYYTYRNWNYIYFLTNFNNSFYKKDVNAWWGLWTKISDDYAWSPAPWSFIVSEDNNYLYYINDTDHKLWVKNTVSQWYGTIYSNRVFWNSYVWGWKMIIKNNMLFMGTTSWIIYVYDLTTNQEAMIMITYRADYLINTDDWNYLMYKQYGTNKIIRVLIGTDLYAVVVAPKVKLDWNYIYKNVMENYITKEQKIEANTDFLWKTAYWYNKINIINSTYLDIKSILDSFYNNWTIGATNYLIKKKDYIYWVNK